MPREFEGPAAGCSGGVELTLDEEDFRLDCAPRPAPIEPFAHVAVGRHMASVVKSHLQIVRGAEHLAGVFTETVDAFELAGAPAHLDAFGDGLVEPFGIVAAGERLSRGRACHTRMTKGRETNCSYSARSRSGWIWRARSSLSSTAISSTAASAPISGSSKLLAWLARVCSAQRRGRARETLSPCA